MWKTCTCLAGLALWASPAIAGTWEDATDATIGATAGWSNKVELADIDGDGRVDIVFANGGSYSSPGAPEANRVFLNAGAGTPFEDGTAQVFGDDVDSARVVKVRDVDGDGVADIFVGTTWQTQSRLYLGDGDGGFDDVTATHLPAAVASIGDAELGDVDGDGDLDLVLADWGAGNPRTNGGGRTRLWLGDGDGRFVDATEERMPDVLVEWSWDLELVDVDNDHDLDVLVACKECTGSFLFRNDGNGAFSHDANALPQFSNNYDFEAMDLDGDGFLELVTINDGPGLRQHMFSYDPGVDAFVDVTDAHWPPAHNLGADDNVVAFVDVDADGDADFVIGSLNGDDRLLVNDGDGNVTVDTAAFSGAATPGTLGLAFADLDGDGRLDAVQSQGEVASPDKVFLGVDVAVDTAPPAIENVEQIDAIASGSDLVVRARVHDRKTPVAAHDFAAVELRAGDQTVTMQHIGGMLWRGRVAGLADGATTYQVCATDARDNDACSAGLTVDVGGAVAPDAGPDAAPSPDAGPDTGATGDDAGCGCQSSTSTGGMAAFFILLLLARKRR